MPDPASAGEVLFLDDREVTVTVAAARAAGIKAFVGTGADDARRHIAEFDGESSLAL